MMYMLDPPHSCDIGSLYNYLDHGESAYAINALINGESACAMLMPIVGPNDVTPIAFHACIVQAIKDHSKELNNNGEITTKIISTIATDDPITDALLLCGKDSQQPRTYILCFPAHVSQVIGTHAKDLDNDGEITTKLISTITTKCSYYQEHSD
jgi:hypothetical protein